MRNKTITIEATVRAPIETVWRCWTAPEHITQWCFASNDWEAPHAENDIRVGGRFLTRMAAKSGGDGFDFTGIYTVVMPYERIAYEITGGRHVSIHFVATAEGVKVTETFEMEDENSEELQRAGWQAILDNFMHYVESKQ